MEREFQPRPVYLAASWMAPVGRYTGKEREDLLQISGTPKKCTVEFPFFPQERICLRAGKFDIADAGLCGSFPCYSDRLRPPVQCIYLSYQPYHGHRDFSGTAPDLKNGVGRTQAEFEEGYRHDLVLGRTAGKFRFRHLLNFGCGKVLILVLSSENRAFGKRNASFRRENLECGTRATSLHAQC